ncbi:hypothetical protein HDU79_006021 [Rhizoclosmatium sp. JEL0117]|nr:hypothetical protein HDU79_006021 [Rhizoclosmatium sp. JEL0117]
MDTQTVSNIIQWSVTFPIGVCGIILNLFLLVIVILNRKTLLSSRIDQIYTLLLTLCLTWSTLSSTKLLVWGTGYGTVLNQLNAAGSSLPVCTIIGANCLLAMERYAIVRDAAWVKMRWLFLGVIVLTTGVFGAMVFSFATSPCSNGIYPDYMLQRWVWVVSAAVGFLGGFPIIVVSYSLAYVHMRQQLDKAAANHHVNVIRMAVQRKVLRNSIIMSIGVIGCYLPAWLVIALVAGGAFQGDLTVTVVTQLAFAMMLADVLLTPCLVLHFSMVLRTAVLRTFGRRLEEDEEFVML